MDAIMVKVVLCHNCSSIPNARWCYPLGFDPVNKVEGAEYENGAWWDGEEEVAGLVWLGNPDEYGAHEHVAVPLDSLRVATSGDCRVIGRVEI